MKTEDGDTGRLQEQLKATEKQFEEEKKKLLDEVNDYKVSNEIEFSNQYLVVTIKAFAVFVSL